ncbi:DNA-binding transcriptional regulator, MarR family [Actinomadura meyerae]|jgi:DNA-binding MarR family transcriptional regulator|uniref:DNA-binding transcriptional regulator, MarR family n=1 Tax=Actinomadura meyerae TaxID=240840 RepID=A0A239MQN4_9ACTN|nr:MarR family transcriptional regulator [Actinomadura meyerae]SNT44442.1 DNA-binding transcriptional regulator, MarR family [Actinomadura meyerae]
MVGTPGEEAADTAAAAALDDVAATLMTVWSRPHNDPELPVPSMQLRALLVLERGPVNVSRLAGELGALVSSASRLCDRLEASGLLARDSGRDRREVTVRLSADGRELVGRLRERRLAELKRVLSQMPASARAALLWGLTEFQEAAARRDGDGDSLSMLA